MRDTRWSGRFWLPAEPSATVGGWLDVSGRWPRLELAEPLTPGMHVVYRTVAADGSVLSRSRPADDPLEPDGLTVHGMLRGSRRRVTLVCAVARARTMVFGGPVPDPGDQTLQPAYVLFGGHQTGPHAVFARVRLRLRHLDAWAQLGGVEVRVVEDGSQFSVVHERQEPETAEVPGMDTRVVLDSVVPIPDPTVLGAAVTRAAELWLEVHGGMTLDRLSSGIALPPLCVGRWVRPHGGCRPFGARPARCRPCSRSPSRRTAARWRPAAPTDTSASGTCWSGRTWRHRGQSRTDAAPGGGVRTPLRCAVTAIHRARQSC